MSGLAVMEVGIDLRSLVVSDDVVRGGNILDGKGTLVRFEELEGMNIDLPVDLVDPNPNQPRGYFDEKKMAELTSSIKENGQKQQIKVVPYLSGGEVRFFLVDGERRYRAVAEIGLETVKSNVEWYSTEEEIFIASFLYNLEREEHNQIEEAKSYRRILEMQTKKGLTQAEAYKALSAIVSRPVIRLQNMIKLLELPEEVQVMVAEGALPDRHALNLVQARRKYGESLNVLKLARTIVDNPDNVLEVAKRGKVKGEVTAEAVKAEIRRQMLENEALTPKQAVELEVAEAVLRVATSVASLTNAITKLLKMEKPLVIAALQNRGRGNPPEAMARDLRTLLQLSKELVMEVIQPATEAPKLEKLIGRPNYADYVERHLKDVLPEVHYWTAFILACASDNQAEVFTASEIAEGINELDPNLDVDSNVVASAIKYLELSLKSHGLAVDIIEKRVKTEDGIRKKNAYRLKWYGIAKK